MEIMDCEACCIGKQRETVEVSFEYCILSRIGKSTGEIEKGSRALVHVYQSIHLHTPPLKNINAVRIHERKQKNTSSRISPTYV